MMKSSAIIIAYKINDAFYATLTEEFITSNTKTLISFCQIPEVISNKFDYIVNLEYKRDIKGILRNLFKLSKLDKSFRYIISSNLQLFYSKAIISISRSSNIVIIEDGVMNYKQESLFEIDSFDRNIPTSIKKILKISEGDILKRITRGYFLSPQNVKYKIEKRKIELLADYNRETEQLHSILCGAKIFIGQPLYKMGLIEKADYFSGVKTAAKALGLDYYIPHHAENLEDIECNINTLDISSYGCTLEMIGKNLEKLLLATFSSSVAYTLPLINNNISSIILKTEKYQSSSIISIYKTIVDPERIKIFHID